MDPVASVKAIRTAESAWSSGFQAGKGAGLAELMQRAAQAVAGVGLTMLTLESNIPARILVVAGSGNNAGDALWAVAHMVHHSGRPLEVAVWPVSGVTHTEGLTAACAAGALLVDAERALELAPQVELIIDGFTGIGGRPGLPPLVAALAGAAEYHRTSVLAVDIPSGLAADRPGASASFRATQTVTFIAPKLAHVALPAALQCGAVTGVDLGVSPPSTQIFTVTESDLIDGYPWPNALSDKYSRGVVGLDTGSRTYPGAAILGVSGALHAGAGLVRYVGPARAAVLAAHPSVVASTDARHPGRVQAWVCGSGWPRLDTERRARRHAEGVPLVLDASALLDPPSDLDARSILTPHAGELARLLGVDRSAVTDDPVGHVQRAASETGACVLLKGATHYCSHPDGRVLIAESGPAWTAVAGSGDVLAGIVGALIAAGVDAWRAGPLAASLQARAAAWCPGPRTPDEVASDGLPRALAALQSLSGAEQ